MSKQLQVNFNSYQEDKDPQAKEAKTTDGNTDHKYFDKKTVVGMGKDGLDNLQTLKANALSPLPQPRSESVTKESTLGRRSHTARYTDIKISDEQGISA